MSSPSNQAPGEPEVPPEIPPEYADAYLAGFRRGLEGLPPEAPADRVEPAPAPPATGGHAHHPETVAAPEASEQAAEPAAPDRRPEIDAEAGQARGDADLEWLFDRRESGPPGWSVGATRGTEEDATGDLHADTKAVAAPSGASSVAGSGPRSPWPLLGAFVVVLALLMLLAYLGGMAFSTIMDR